MVDRDVAASATAVRIARTPSPGIQGADGDLEPYAPTRPRSKRQIRKRTRVHLTTCVYCFPRYMYSW